MTRAAIRKELERVNARIGAVLTQGNAVISKYDLTMGYDSNYYLNPNSCLFAQRAYYERKLEELKNQGEQLTLGL